MDRRRRVSWEIPDRIGVGRQDLLGACAQDRQVDWRSGKRAGLAGRHDLLGACAQDRRRDLLGRVAQDRPNVRVPDGRTTGGGPVPGRPNDPLLG